MAETIEYSLLGAMCPVDTEDHELYQVPANTQINAPLRVCNQSEGDQSYGVAHTMVSGPAQPGEWIINNRTIPAGETDELSIHAAAGQTVRIRAGAAGVLCFHLSGQKIVKGVA